MSSSREGGGGWSKAGGGGGGSRDWRGPPLHLDAMAQTLSNCKREHINMTLLEYLGSRLVFAANLFN